MQLKVLSVCGGVCVVRGALVFEVNERVDAKGQVVTSLDDFEVAELARHLVTIGVDAVAVCLLHSFRDARHERTIAEVFRCLNSGYSLDMNSSFLKSCEFSNNQGMRPS